MERLAKGQLRSRSSALMAKADLEVPYFPSTTRKASTFNHADKDGAIFLWAHEPFSNKMTFRTFSLHPQKGGGVELRKLAELTYHDPAAIQFKSGLIAAAYDDGKIT